MSRAPLARLPAAPAIAFAARTAIVRAPWRAGPVRGHRGQVVISATKLVLAQQRDRPPAILAGLRLREGWYAMPGALGLSLWASPGASGSISAWTDQDSLRAFVGLPAHIKIMRAYRDRGQLVSTTWTDDDFDLERAYREALRHWR